MTNKYDDADDCHITVAEFLAECSFLHIYQITFTQFV